MSVGMVSRLAKPQAGHTNTDSKTTSFIHNSVWSKRFYSEIKQWGKPRDGNQTKHRDRNDPECQALVFQCTRNSAGRSRQTNSWRQIETTKSKRKKQQRQSNENWSVRFERSQRADPSAAYSEGKKN